MTRIMTRTTTTIRSRATVFGLLWMAAIGLLSLEVDARRRDPLSELVHVEGRRLMEERNSGSNSNSDGKTTTTTSALLKDSVRGTRSVIGTTVHVPVAETPEDHLVTDLPLLQNKDFKGKHWAGLLPVNDKKDGYLFYWLFAPNPEKLQQAKTSGVVQEDESNVPLLLWLNGGPACSSMDGLWIENGPFRLDPGDDSSKDWNNIKVFPHSWHNAPAYVLYVDQPVGTGLAFTTSGNYPNNDQRVNEDFYYFLTEFMKLHDTTLGFKPEKYDGIKQKIKTLQRPFFLSGESHAGHYIPSMMNYIRKQNQFQQKFFVEGGVIIPLSGAAIGNGWFDPIYQYSAHEAAYGYGLIGKAQERALAKKEEQCRENLRNKKYTSSICFNLLTDVVSNSLGSTNPNTVSQYDQRVRESRKGVRNFPPGHKDVEAYLGQAREIPNANVHDVLKAIHAGPSWDSGQRYRECTDPPYNALSHQDGLGVVPDIVDLLEHTGNSDGSNSIRLLFFNGIHDLICNHAGNENALENLPWKHQAQYIQAERYGWNAPSTGKLGGYAKEFRNLVFLKVLDSGHMVPLDVPEIAMDMMVAFLYADGGRGIFNTYQQTIAPVLDDDNGGVSCPDASGSSSSSSSKIQDCPVCENSAKCTKHQCQQTFDDDDEDWSTLGLASPMYSGILWGVSVFSILALCCVCGTKYFGFVGTSGTKSRKQPVQSQIELPSPRIGGGYRDDDNDDDNDNGFDDEKMM